MLLSETRRRDTLPYGMTDEQRPATPESVDDELARLRRLAVVDELLTTLVGVLDVRDVLRRVSEVAGGFSRMTPSRCQFSLRTASTRSRSPRQDPPPWPIHAAIRFQKPHGTC